MEGCNHTGFVYLKDNDVSTPLLRDAFAWAKKFFDLDEEKKAEVASIPDSLASEDG